MELMIQALNDKTRVKIYRWLRRHKAFSYFLDGKNFNTFKGKTTEQIRKVSHNDNEFAFCEGNYFFLDFLNIKENKDLMEKIFNYLHKLKLKEKYVIIAEIKHMDKEGLKYFFGYKNINSYCEGCPFYLMHKKKHKE